MTLEKVTNAIRIKRRGIARFAGGAQRRNCAFRRTITGVSTHDFDTAERETGRSITY